LFVIAPTAASTGHPIQRRRKEHDMRQFKPFLRCARLETVDGYTGRRGKYQHREHKQHDVQRSGRPELCQSTKPMMRQSWRARRERVKNEHTNGSGKADTGRSWFRS
jgi:hypothetical protein